MTKKEIDDVTRYMKGFCERLHKYINVEMDDESFEIRDYVTKLDSNDPNVTEFDKDIHESKRGCIVYLFILKKYNEIYPKIVLNLNNNTIYFELSHSDGEHSEGYNINPKYKIKTNVSVLCSFWESAIKKIFDYYEIVENSRVDEYMVRDLSLTEALCYMDDLAE